MASISIRQFRGEAPRVAPKLLSNEQGQRAEQCRFENGQITSWYGNEADGSHDPTSGGYDFTGTKTLWLYLSQYWFSWDDDVDVVRGPLEDDGRDRVYYTHDPAANIPPRVTSSSLATGYGSDYPLNYYELGIPAPSSALSASNSPSCDEADQISTAYVYTYVSGWGEEGPPSPASNIIDRCEGDSVSLSSIDTAPSGNFNITNKNIYRAQTGEQGTDYQFVRQIDVANTSAADSVKGADLGEVLPSRGWDPPPDDLHGLVSMPNGIIAGFKGRDVYFCEPYLPHAWPTKYRLATDYPIVGLGVFGQTLVVLTEEHPYLVSGTTPGSMTMRELDRPLPCISKRSIASSQTKGVMYASPDGLVLVSSNGAQLITQQVHDRRSWQTLNPKTIDGYLHDNRYFGFYDNGHVKSGFIFDLDDPESGWSPLNFHATAAYNDDLNDELYFVIGSGVENWDSDIGNPLTYVWRSKLYVLSQYHNFGVVQVVADTYNSLKVRVYGDHTKRNETTVSDNAPIRLPDGFLAREWEIEVQGIDNVQEIHLATTPGELGRG